MFYTSIFLTFDIDEIYRNVFYIFIFLERKISLTSKMFYFKDTRVYDYVLEEVANEWATPMLKD